MTLAPLLASLAPTGLADLAFPRPLLGAFRRKSISFCTGVTDETTVVYWFQSRSFTIDLRLPDGPATPVALRQGWVGDTVWDADQALLSWEVARSYQPRNQWPEPARFHFIGNSVLEFAPSGAYVEDWRQLATSGPYLGLRLIEMTDAATGDRHAMDGGLVLAGEHTAFACSRHPRLDAALGGVESLEEALAQRIASEAEIESYEVSVAIGGDRVTASTQPHRLHQPIVTEAFTPERDGSLTLPRVIGGVHSLLRFVVDHYVPEFTFDTYSASTPEALAWIEGERAHLLRHASVCC
jgi:hypothetical protein